MTQVPRVADCSLFARGGLFQIYCALSCPCTLPPLDEGKCRRKTFQQSVRLHQSARAQTLPPTQTLRLGADRTRGTASSSSILAQSRPLNPHWALVMSQRSADAQQYNLLGSAQDGRPRRNVRQLKTFIMITSCLRTSRNPKVGTEKNSSGPKQHIGYVQVHPGAPCSLQASRPFSTESNVSIFSSELIASNFSWNFSS